MIFVDTSTWVCHLRRSNLALAQHVDELLDLDEIALAIPVLIELSSGAASQRKTLEWTLSALPHYYPTEATWKTMQGWANRAAAVGEHFGLADLMIAALAAENRAPVWSLDGDFARMEKLGFVKRYKV